MVRDNLKIAIAGNPNSGKTTIFNALTGTRQRVANYPGVTVEKKEGSFSHRGIGIDVVDLPGTYSLSANSLDEKIARDFIINDRPDVVVDVIDSSNFERNAYLTAQLVGLGVRLVLVLNMSDRAHSSGQVLDLEMIRERLGCEVVETVGFKGQGIGELKDAILKAAGRDAKEIDIDYGEEFGALVGEIRESILSLDIEITSHDARWIAVKLLEDDADVRSRFIDRHQDGAAAIIEKSDAMRRRVEGHHGAGLGILMAEHRYGFAAGLYREVLRQEPKSRRHFSDSIDDIVANRLIGIPLFLCLMYLVFYVTFRVGEIPMHWIESGVEMLGVFVSSHWPGEGVLKSLLVDGVIGGVGGVIVFLPNIVLLFMCLSVLEDTGYMARVAFIMDKLMHKIGLHGKSFIPLLMGFGCSVPAIMATRTLENRRDRLATMMAIPLMSCGARLPIYTLIIPAFFPEAWRPKVLWLVYITGILLAVLLIRILRSSLLKGESAPFVMELPPYRMPTVKGILLHMWERSKLYLKKAGTIILAVSIFMWVLTSYPKPEPVSDVGRMSRENVTAVFDRSGDSKEAQYSYAGRIGKFIEPAIRPLGFDWRIGTALIGAMAAKEVFVAQLGIIFSLDSNGEDAMTLSEELRRRYSPLAGICVMLFCLISFPCMATLVMTASESGSWRWAILQVFGLTALAYVLTLFVFQVGSLLGWGF